MYGYGACVMAFAAQLAVSTACEQAGEARRTVNEGGAYLNNERVTDAEHRPQEADLVGGSWLVLRRGKKKIAGVEVR